MLRRCLESNAQFGMIMPARTLNSSGNDYGTMLRILSVQMLPDGRSMVETIGTHRFRILESGTLDGYMVARIERHVSLNSMLTAVDFAIGSMTSPTSCKRQEKKV